MKKRIISLILVMTLAWGSLSDIFTGLSYSALAEELPLATPTDLVATADTDSDEDADLTMNPEEDPAENGEEDPAENGEEDPAENGEEDPAENGEADPAENGEEDPAENGEADPAEDREEDPAEDREEDPAEDREEDPAEDREEDPAEPAAEAQADDQSAGDEMPVRSADTVLSGTPEQGAVRMLLRNTSANADDAGNEETVPFQGSEQTLSLGEEAAQTTEKKEQEEENTQNSEELNNQPEEPTEQYIDMPIKSTAVPAMAMLSAPAQNTVNLLGTAAPAANETTEPSILQQMIDQRLNALSGELTGKVRIVLTKNNTYEGTVNISKGERAAADDFELELEAEDAGDDGMQADGSTSFIGQMLITGINVILKGLNLPGLVNVINAKLDYYGTRADDGVNINVTGEDAEATIHSGEGADTVNTEVRRNGKLSVDTGAGTDTVSAKVTGGGSADIATGEGEDTVTLSLVGDGNQAQIYTGAGADTVAATSDGTNSLTIQTGNGSDVIRAEVLDGSHATIDSGEGDDRVEVTLNENSHADIQTGRGDDTIGLRGISRGEGRTEKASIASVNAGKGNDTVTVAGQGDEEAVRDRGYIEIDLGDGMNETHVDLSIANIAKSVYVTGGADSDRLHVTGELDADKSEDDRIENSSTDSYRFWTTGNNSLRISTEDVEILTDNLANKRKETIDLTGQAGEISSQDIQKSFTNYVITGYSGDITALNISKAEGADRDLIMTNVIIAPDADNKNQVAEGKSITAEDLQLVLPGKTVQVNGTVKAGLVRIEAEDGTDRSNVVRLQDGEGAESGQIPLIPIDLGGNWSLELLNITDTAKVTIGQNAKVYSEGDILITSAAEQKGGIINIGNLSTVNLVDLKVARATVDVEGKLYAGYNLETEEKDPAKRGSVHITTSAKTTTGFDKDGNPVNGLPIAIALTNMDSVITIAPGAEIHATDSIRLVSNADLQLAARADSYAGLPVAVAAVYATVDSRVEAEGTLEAGQDVNVAARGSTEVTTIADAGDQNSISGGYVGLAVALQSVKAELGATAEATAGRDVNVESFAREKVDTLASTHSVDENSAAQTAIGATYDAATDVFKEAYETLLNGWDKIQSLFTGEDAAEEREAAEELDKAIRKVSLSDHGIAVDEHAKAKGDVSIKTKTESNTVTNTVTVTPKAGYKVKSVTWRGLNAGDIAYTFGEPLVIANPDGKPVTYSFPQSTKNVTIFVEYEKEETDESDEDDEDEEYDDPEDEANLFEDGETNNNIVVDELLKNVTAAATDDIDDELWDLPKENRTVSLSLPEVRENGIVQGAVLTYATEADGSNLTTVAPGQLLRLVVNPAGGKLLKAGSLKIRYKHGETTEIKLITADNHGRYIVELPANLDPNETVAVFAEFVDDTQTDVAEPQRGTQIAGSAAITITENNNEAVINAKTKKQETADGTVETVAGAQVIAGRNVNVTAESAADIRSTADGTAVNQTTVTGTQAADEEMPTAYGFLFGIPIEEAKIGKVTIFSDHKTADPGDEVRVTVHYNGKEHIKAGTLKAILTSKDGSYREEIFLFRKSDYTFTFRMPKLPGDINVKDLKVTFTGETAEGATGAGVTTSLGAAVALTVSSSHNRADIRGAVDAAGDITVQADGDGAARTETRAGYSEGTTGIGGAVSAQIAAMDSRARIHKTAAVALDGHLALNAENSVQFYVDADGTGSKRNAKNMGIGAGFAVAYDGAQAVAAIEDGATVTGKSGAAIGSLTLRAEQMVDDQVRAAAGAGSSGTSYMAALALDAVTTSAKAKLGDVKGGVLNVKDDVLISANNAAKHDLMAEGAVAGKGTGIGAAISVSLVKDKAIATLGESLNTGSVKVDAVNESAVRNVNIASASGGRNPFRLRVGDDIWLKLITGVVWLASLDDSLPKDYADLWIKYHLPNLMTSSTMGVAGAAGLNIQTSIAKAEISDGINTTAAGKAAVTSQNRTEALVKGDASTTNSTMGIGIGAGVNLVKMDNIAFIGNGSMTAASMEVTATTKEKELSFDDLALSYTFGDEVTEASENRARGLMEDTIGQSIDDYVNDLVREIGLDALLPPDVLDSIIDPVIDSATEEILGLAGLGEMFSDGIIQEAVEFFGDTWYISKWVLVGVLAAGIETDVLNLDKLGGFDKAQAVVDQFKDEFNTMLIVSVRDSVVHALKNSISSLFHLKAPSGDAFSAIFTNGYDDVLDFIKSQLKPTLKALDRKLLMDLAALCGNENLTDAQATEIITLARSDDLPKESLPYVEAAMNFLGIEGDSNTDFMCLSQTVDQLAKKFIDYNKTHSDDDSGSSSGSGTEDSEPETADGQLLIQVTELGEEKVTLGDAIIKLAEAQNVMLTDDQMAVLHNPYDLVNEAQKASAGTHLIDTQAISGAGASGTSLSGAGAVTKLDFTTKAQVGYDKLSETAPDKEKDYTVSLTDDYIKKVTKPKGTVSDEEWAQYLEWFTDPVSFFVRVQKKKTEEYKEAVADYNKKKKELEKQGTAASKEELKKLKKPEEKDYKLTAEKMASIVTLYVLAPEFADLYEDDDWYDDLVVQAPQISSEGKFEEGDWFDDFMKDLVKKANDYIDKQEKLDKQYKKDVKAYEKAVDLNKEQLGGQINVAGDVLIDADNSRLVNNVASASLNGKGNASTNASAADAANSDVGDSSTNRKVTAGKNVHMTTDVGIQASISEEDQEKDRPKIQITVKDGFELEKDEDGKYYAKYSYSSEETGDEGATGNEGGIETDGKIEIKKDSKGNLYIDTNDVPGVDTDKILYFTLGTQEVLRKVRIANPIANGVNVSAGAVTAQVKGRDLDEDDELSARAGDTVVVTVQKKDGMLPDYIKYSYQDKNGKAHTVEINPTVVTGRDYAYASVTKNGDEYILSFRMPDADENGVTIETQFSEYAEDPSWMPGTSFKLGISAGLLGPSISGFGRGMGVGASLTMLMGEDDTIAMIGDRQKGADGKENSTIDGITAGKLTIIANSDHRETLSSVAGTDPLSGESTADTISKTSLDASAAVNMLDTSIRADLDKINKTRVNGYESGSIISKGDVTMSAADHSETSLNASAFSAGRGTAVGASVVVNMATNEATVDVGPINATGNVTVKAESHSRDSATAVASAVGADVIRILRVAGVDLDDENDSDEIADKTEKVAGGETESSGEDPDAPTQNINNRLNANSEKNCEEDDTDEGEKTSDSMSLSSNVLRSQGVTTDIPDKEQSDMEATMDGVNLLAQIGLTGLSAYTHFKNLFCGKKTMISASVASTQATHTANVNLHGNIKTEGDISVTADNTADFSAMATAASMSLLPKATAVSGGVSIVDNKNEANIKVMGDLIAGKTDSKDNAADSGDITLKSTLTQNLSEDYIGKLAAQSVSGSVAGYGSTAAIGAAISIVKSKGKTTVEVSDGKEDNARQITGKNIDIEAVDQTRIASRAGGVSISMGSSIGVGMGVSKIKSSNTVAATIGKYTDISGTSFTLNAEKKEVTEKDYKNLLDMRNSNSNLVSYSQKDEAGKENNVKVNLYADKILDLYDGINKYSFQNNYVEAIGATAGLIPGKVSVGGAVAIIQTSNDVKATLGEGLYMEIKPAGGKGSGNAEVTATDRATNRMIAGGLSISPSSASVGAAVALMENKDTATARIGSVHQNKNEDGKAEKTLTGDTYIDATGDVKLASEVGGTAQAFTAAMSMAISVKRVKEKDPNKPEKDLNNKTTVSGGSVALAGAANYIINTATATTETGSDTKLKGNGKTTLTSKADNDMMALAADSNISIGWKAPAVGAAANIIHDQTGAYTTIGANNTVKGKKTEIGSDTASQLISAVASQSAAATGSGKALAAAVNYNYAAAEAKTTIGGEGKKKTQITASEGDADIYAKTDAWGLTGAVSLSGSVNSALGGSVNINTFDRLAKTNIYNTEIQAGKGNARIQSSGKDTSYMVGILMEGSVTGSSFGGNVVYHTEDNNIRTNLSGNTTVTAGKNALIESYFEDKTVGAVGSITLANIGSAVGATGIVVTKQNSIQTLLNDSKIEARNGDGATIKNLSGDKVDGIYVGANAKENQSVGGAGISLSGSVAAAATAVSLKSKNTVTADASDATLKAIKNQSSRRAFQENTLIRFYDKDGIFEGEYNLGEYPTGLLDQYIWDALEEGRRVDLKYPGEETYQRIRSYKDLKKTETTTTGGSVTVEAKNTATEKLLAGGVNFGLGAGVGAAAVVLLAENKVEATAKNIEAAEDVKIDASNTDDLLLLNINAGASAKLALDIGVTISDLNSTVEALAAGGEIRAWNGAVDVTAENTTNMTNVGVSVGAGKTAAAAPVFLYTGFNGKTNAILGGGKVNAGKGVTVKADSAKDDLDFYAVGAAFASHTALSGAVTVVAAKDQTNALVTTGTEINAGSLTIDASSYFKETAASATLVGSKKYALGVSGIVNIIKASTLAEMEGAAEVRGKTTVKASASRDVLNVGANAAFSGGVAGGMTVMVLVAGDKMDQDAANQLTYGNTKDGKDKAFDSSALVEHLESKKVDTSALGKMTYDLEGNGQKIDTSKLGHQNENGQIKFDASSGYGGSETGDEDDNDPNETKDLENARTVGSTVYTDSPKDSVKARIGDHAVIIADEVDVEAEQETLADLFGATAGVGGKIGGGISFAAAKLRSNVIAASLGNLDVTEGRVTVNALSKSGEVNKEANEDESNRMKALVDGLDQKLDPSNRSIRAIGLAVGGGAQTGFSIAAGAVRLDNITQATLSGSVKNAAQVIVNSDASYSNVMAATLALAGAGEGAIAASIAAAVAEGTVNSTMDEKTSVAGTGTHVFVTTNSTVNVDTVAATAAASGGGAVIAGLSLAVNNLTQNTTVERGAQIEIRTPESVSNGSLHVNGVSNTTAHARLMGLTAGTVGVGMGVAIAKIKPTVHTTVGVEGDNDKVTTLNKLWNTEVTNTVTSSAETDLLTAAAGGVAVAGNVLLVYNDTDALAKVGGVTGYLDGDLTIHGKLRAEGDSKATAASVGGVSVGATINHVDVNSVNTADLDIKDFSLQVRGTLQVIAGEKQESIDYDNTVWHTIARASTYAGSAGLVSLGVNTGVVRNRAQNNAYITGDSLEVNSVVVRAFSAGKAEASVLGLSAGVASVAVSVVNAINESTSRAYVDLKGSMNSSLDVSSDVRGKTDAKLLTGTGALLGGVYTNVATARGRTASIARANIGAQPKYEDRNYTVSSTGRDDVNSLIENVEAFTSGAILTVGVMVGRAFSTDVYDAELSLTGGTTYKLKKVSVTTDYVTHVNAETTPSKGGVQTNLVGVGVNKATAKNKAYALAKFQIQGIAGEKEADDKPTKLEASVVSVQTTGSADANAIVKPAEFQTNLAVGVGVNKAKADVSGTQAAVLQLGLGGIEKAQLVDVQSIVNKTDAQATIGASGAKDADRDKIKISAVSVDSNSSTANASLASTATVMGGVTGKTTIEGMVDYGHWEEREETYIDYDTAVELETYANTSFVLDGTRYNGRTGIYYELYNRYNDLLYTTYSKKDRDQQIDYFLEHGSNPVTTRTKSALCAEGEDGNYYLVKTEKRNVWVSELKPGKVKVNIFNPAKNILKADALNIYAGMAEEQQSTATANSNGSKAFGIVTVGDLNASAYTGESISAMLEGVTATITGEANIMAASNTKAIATGYEPGGWSAAGGTKTNAKSGVGTQDEKETVTVVIGTGAMLKARIINLIALNNGEAESSIEKEESVGILANISKGSLPTESWYDTLISVGAGARVESTDGDVNLLTSDASDSTSKVKSSGFSVGVNYNSMKGENEVHQENNIDIVDGAAIIAHYGNVLIQAWQCTKATAETKYDGTGAVFAGSTMKAENIVERVVRVNIGENAKITADTSNYGRTGGNVVIMASSGIGNAGNKYLKTKYDNIYTKASVESKGFVGLSNAKAHADIESIAEIVVQGGAEIEAKRKVKLEALSSSRLGSSTFSADLLSVEEPKYHLRGIATYAEALSKGGIPLPNAVAKNTLNFITFINIHMRDEDKADTPSELTTKITSREDEVILKASNERLSVMSRAESSGKGAAGVSNANAWNDATLSNAVWIDDAELRAYKDLVITADNGGMDPKKSSVSKGTVKATYIQTLQPDFWAWSSSKLKAVGKAKAHSRITGVQINQIRSYDVDSVTLSSTTGQVIHLASEPKASVRSTVEANAKVPKIFGIKLGKTKTKEELIWYYYNRCDFCDIGTEYDVKPTEQMSLQKRYKEAYERALQTISDIQRMADKTGAITRDTDTTGTIPRAADNPGAHTGQSDNQPTASIVTQDLRNGVYVRALLPISDIQRMADKNGAITRAHYGLFDDQTVASIFALDLQKILERDIRLDAEKIAKYKLWTNSETDHTTYLLPNATQMHLKAGRLEFVTEILRGGALGDGIVRYISIYTAVTQGAYARGIIPIGSTGTLNFRTGMLLLPSHADYELYLHEVSSTWLLKQFESGMMRRATASQESLNACALENGELPDMTYEDALIPDGEQNGWLVYWLGHTPETVKSADETLIYLLVNPETDEIDAFRTSLSMLDAGDALIDVSLYIYRDAKADRNEEELYDVFFFDTPEGEMSLVKVITNTPGEEMQIPRSLQIKLRSFRVKDSEETAYSLYNQLLILSKTENGRASALGGFYTAAFNDDTFESDYVLISGVADGNPVVLVKKDQPIWGEWTGEDTAETIDENSYKLIEDVWYEANNV